MSPNPPRSKRGELPKPVIQRGVLGWAPVSDMAVSCVFHGHGDRILGIQGAEETLFLKNRPIATLRGDDRSEKFFLDGKIFNGAAEALYRGALPEVVVAVVDASGIDAFMEDVIAYIGKLLAMGFFLPKKELVQRDRVADYVPCLVLTGGGLLFSIFVTGLMSALRAFEHQYPVMNEALRLRIVGRCVRGMTDSAGIDAVDDPANLKETGKHPGVFRLLQPPSRLRIAGGSLHSQELVRAAFAMHGLSANLETRSRNAVERMEFEDAFHRFSRVILPVLTDKARLPEPETRLLAQRFTDALLAVGKSRFAFEETDRLQTSPATPLSADPGTGSSADSPSRPADKRDGTKDEKTPVKRDSKSSGKTGASRKSTTAASRPAPLVGSRISPMDLSVIHHLGAYAASLGLSSEQRFFQDLAEKVAPHCQ